MPGVSHTPTGTAEQGAGGSPTISVDNKKLPDKIQPACVE